MCVALALTQLGRAERRRRVGQHELLRRRELLHRRRIRQGQQARVELLDEVVERLGPLGGLGLGPLGGIGLGFARPHVAGEDVPRDERACQAGVAAEAAGHGARRREERLQVLLTVGLHDRGKSLQVLGAVGRRLMDALLRVAHGAARVVDERLQVELRLEARLVRHLAQLVQVGVDGGDAQPDEVLCARLEVAPALAAAAAAAPAAAAAAARRARPHGRRTLPKQFRLASKAIAGAAARSG
eukprot:103042-Chlamydomonas_euryale.AAC.1